MTKRNSRTVRAVPPLHNFDAEWGRRSEEDILFEVAAKWAGRVVAVAAILAAGVLGLIIWGVVEIVKAVTS